MASVPFLLASILFFPLFSTVTGLLPFSLTPGTVWLLQIDEFVEDGSLVFFLYLLVHSLLSTSFIFFFSIRPSNRPDTIGFNIVDVGLVYWFGGAVGAALMLLRALLPATPLKFSEPVRPASSTWLHTLAAFAFNKFGTAFGACVVPLHLRGDMTLNELQRGDEMTEEEIEMVKQVVTWNPLIVQFIYLCVALLLGGTICGLPGCALVLAGFSIYLFGQFEPSSMRYIPRNERRRDLGLPPGLYSLTTTLFGVPVSRGIGYLTEGVLHSRYHVTQGASLSTPTGSHPAIDSDSVNDIVSYGGPSKYITPYDGESIHITAVDVTDHTCDIVAFTSIYNRSGTNGIAKTAVSKPGSSGSPVFVVRDGKPFLAAVTGLNVPLSDDSQAEVFPVVPSNSIDIHAFRSDAIIAAPGAGKTSKIVEIVRECFSHGKLAIVTAPTNALCRQLAGDLREALKNDRDPQDRLLVVSQCFTRANGNPGDPFRGRIRVIPHQSLLRHIHSAPSPFPKDTVFIVDEPHWPSWESIVLINMLWRLAFPEAINNIRQHPKCFLKLVGATMINPVDQREIVDPRANEEVSLSTAAVNDFPQAIAQEFANGASSILVFVPTILKRSDVSLYGDHLANLFSRDPSIHIRLFSRAINKEFGDPTSNKKLIISTSKGEVGLNFEVDVVFDTMQTITSLRVGSTSVFKQEVTTITLAAQVQRKGRVGRFKKGKYISPPFVEPTVVVYDRNSADYVGAASVLAALGIENRFSVPGDPSLHVMLHAAQATAVIIEQSVNPISANLVWSQTGQRMTKQELAMTCNFLWMTHAHARSSHIFTVSLPGKPDIGFPFLQVDENDLPYILSTPASGAFAAASTHQTSFIGKNLLYHYADNLKEAFARKGECTVCHTPSTVPTCWACCAPARRSRSDDASTAHGFSPSPRVFPPAPFPYSN